jgi:CheY-like chemotaxis protein
MVKTRTVIVADDDDDIRDCIAGVLRDEGLHVRAVRHGRAALELLELLGDENCVLLLDLLMPVMSGVEALDVLERAGRLPALPVIVCSASKDRQSLPAGVRHVITKPIDLDRLLTLVPQVCASPASDGSPGVNATASAPLAASIIDAACDVLEGDRQLASDAISHDARVHRLRTVRSVLHAWKQGKLTTERAELALRDVFRASS